MDKTTNQKQEISPNFRGSNNSSKGIMAGLATLLAMSIKQPVVEISIIDLFSMIIPRTLLDAKTNKFAALETFRRESSGLIINCLTPGLFVMGAAKAVKNLVVDKKFRHLKLDRIWTNEDSANLLSKHWQEAKGEGKDKIKNYVGSILNSTEGLNGDADKDGWKDFKKAGLEKEIDEIVELIDTDKGQFKLDKKKLDKICENIAQKTSATQTLKVDKKDFSLDLKSLVRDITELGTRFKDKAVSSDLTGFNKSFKKLVNTKSLAGLAVVIPLAMSAQYINRWITEKSSGQKGAPIYKDFGAGNTQDVLKVDKKELLRDKVLASGTIAGLTVASMMQKPSLKMLQFTSALPSMNQCRWIAMATFISRFASSQDKNDLREHFMRDVVSFCSLYFLGDYISKGIATGIEKFNPNIKLLNRQKVAGKDANIFKKFGYWIKHTSVKGFDELPKSAHKSRAACQIGSIAFAMTTLGIILPSWSRSITNKNYELHKKKQQQENIIKAPQAQQRVLYKYDAPKPFANFLNKNLKV